ncbi:hypothetical protein ILUMI_14268 [Ignelater luminosus]|uniref:DDE-1 domain-containing protein n=1 Tax=Ignelater luminosus TaxID=2038154 RepID=A0A8K0C3H9_IGNLU|nr:hypothetical protein ILUMI_26768 [Ignelater luminosus]KAF2891905.1 hypothetical protein ILUMI_14268 [Ignelater luminosus]
MNNHEGINLCKNSGVTVSTVPPHCTHRLQPLDVDLLKPFHTFYNDALCSWEKANPDPKASTTLVFNKELTTHLPLRNVIATAFIYSPSDIRGYPKKTRTVSGKNMKRKGKTMIDTGTPEKTEIETNRIKKAKLKNTSSGKPWRIITAKQWKRVFYGKVPRTIPVLFSHM